MRIRFLLPAILAVVSAPALAVSVSEGDVGDFGGDFGTAFALGTLEVGTNTFSGNLSADDVADVVSFTIPEGFQLFDGQISSEGEGPEGAMWGFELFVVPPGEDPVSIDDDQYLFGESDAYVDGEVLPSGDYLFGVGSIFVEGEFSLDWIATGDVQPIPDLGVIPLPGGLPLLAAGLLPLAVASRRRR